MFEDIVCENNVFCFYLFMMIDFFQVPFAKIALVFLFKKHLKND